MSKIKISNFSRSTLALGCTATDVTLNVADASVFPSITGEEYFFLVLENATLQREIVKCTAKAANALTVVRAQESTSALAWNQGDRVALRLTAGTLEARLTELETALTTRMDTIEDSLADQVARIAVGEIMDWPTEVVPTGFLECDGSAVSRTTYADLFSAIGTRYGAGDSVTTFNIPDRRGEGVRGWDHGAGRDLDVEDRTNRGDGTTGDAVGTKQSAAMQRHAHPAGWQSGYAQGGASGTNPGARGSSQIAWTHDFDSSQITDAELQAGSGYGGSAPTAKETHGRNVSTMFVIRYA